MATFFRLHPTDQDPDDLLDPAEQVTSPWGDDETGRPCDKCHTSGTVDHRCRSCASGAEAGCPACHGQVAFTGRCPVCKGSGRVVDPVRDGISVFPTADGLLRYMIDRQTDLEGCLLVELAGETTGEPDFDADEGALLVRPTAIVHCERLSRERVERARAQGGS